MTREKVIKGKVLSNRMKKTVVVAVERRFRHPRLGKTITRTTKLYAHDEGEIASPGDIVELVESRPLSRLKRWCVLRVTTKEKKVEALEDSLLEEVEK